MTSSEKVKVVLIVLVLYGAIAEAWFRFAHPCLTDTQLILHTVDALLWHQLPGVCR